MLYCQVLPPFIPMYVGSLDRHEAIYTDSHAPHSLVICSSKGGNGTSQACLPTHTWTSSGQLRALGSYCLVCYPPQIQYNLLASIPHHGGCQWARGVCTVRGHWVSVTANIGCMRKYTAWTSMPFMGRYVCRSQQLQRKEFDSAQYTHTGMAGKLGASQISRTLKYNTLRKWKIGVDCCVCVCCEFEGVWAHQAPCAVMLLRFFRIHCVSS